MWWPRKAVPVYNASHRSLKTTTHYITQNLHDPNPVIRPLFIWPQMGFPWYVAPYTVWSWSARGLTKNVCATDASKVHIKRIWSMKGPKQLSSMNCMSWAPELRNLKRFYLFCPPRHEFHCFSCSGHQNIEILRFSTCSGHQMLDNRY